MASNIDLSQAIANFKGAAHGKDVRASLVEVAEAVEEAVNNQVLVLDTTLSESGKAADAGAVDAQALLARGNLPAAADLDEYRTSGGWYVRGTDVRSSPGIHAWPWSDLGGNLIVKGHGIAAATSGVIQIAVSTVSEMQVRTYQGGSWTAWWGLDSTLTKSGYLADAKVVGDALATSLLYRAALEKGSSLTGITSPGVYYLYQAGSYTGVPDWFDPQATGILWVGASNQNSTGAVQILMQATPKMGIRYALGGAYGAWSRDLCPAPEVTDLDLRLAAAVGEGRPLPIPWEAGTFHAEDWTEVSSEYYIRSCDLPAAGCVRLSFTIPAGYRLYCMVLHTDGTGESLGYREAPGGFFPLEDPAAVRVVLRESVYQPGITPEIGDQVEAVLHSAAAAAAWDFRPRGLMAAFKRFAVYSDSLGAGHVYPDPSTTAGAIDDKSISWPVYLARQLRSTVYNHSLHGMSPDTFILGELRGQPTGDNSLACALDGDHDVPLVIICYGANNSRSIPLGTLEDIDLEDCTQNADTIYGCYGRIIQEISGYYAAKGAPVHIGVLLYGTYPTETAARTVKNRWTAVMDLLRDTVEAEGNVLFPIDLLDRRPWDMGDPFFSVDVIQHHWTSIGYRALGELVGDAVSRYIWEHPEDFTRIEFAPANDYIESYDNPENYT
jgi:hypothetical protein